MKKLSIYDILEGYDDLNLTEDIDAHALVEPVLLSMEIKEDSLLFVIDTLGKAEVLNTTDLNATPYAIIASGDKEIINADCPIIRVGNPREALAYAISNACEIDYGKIKFIGVTGTNGKTTTATLIYGILRKCGYKVGLIGTGTILSDGERLSESSYSMTTPDPTLLYPSIKRMANDGCEYIVMEVSSHSLSLGKISPIQFEYAIFTNLDNDHLDFHGSKDDYFQAKLKLFSKTKRGLFNLDDKYSEMAYELSKCEKTTFGIINQGDAFATEISFKSLKETDFYYRRKNLIFKAHTNLGGAFNVYNAMSAITAILDLGIKPCIVKRALEEIDGVCGRMEIISGDITAVIDYAHTPMAFYNLLKALKSNLKSRQRLTVVFGCGGDRDRGKRSTFGEYAETLADKIIITEDNSRGEAFESIVNDILSGIKKSTPIIIPDREKAIRYAIMQANVGDVVAMIGKGHERYKIVGNEYLPFDERKIICDAMRERGVLHESDA